MFGEGLRRCDSGEGFFFRRAMMEGFFAEGAVGNGSESSQSPEAICFVVQFSLVALGKSRAVLISRVLCHRFSLDVSQC